MDISEWRNIRGASGGRRPEASAVGVVGETPCGLAFECSTRPMGCSAFGLLSPKPKQPNSASFQSWILVSFGGVLVAFSRPVCLCGWNLGLWLFGGAGCNVCPAAVSFGFVLSARLS